MPVTTAQAQPKAPDVAPDIALAYRSLRHALLGYLRKHVSDSDVAEELLHEVFLKALSAMERGDKPLNLTGWLYTIARNSVIDHYRGKRPSEALPEDLAVPESDDNLVEQDLARCLKPLTESLPPLYRKTLLATDFDGQTMQALADQEEVSLSAIKSRASRGRQMLRQSLLKCCTVEVSSNGQVQDFYANSPPAQCSGPAGSCNA